MAPLEVLAWFALLAAVTAGMILIRGRLNEAGVALAYLLVVQGGVRGAGALWACRFPLLLSLLSIGFSSGRTAPSHFPIL